MSVAAIFTWVQTVPPGSLIRQVPALFPLIECMHLCALAMLAGSVLVLDLRMLGFGFRELTVTEVYSGVRTPGRVGLLFLLFSGALLFSAEAAKLYGNEAFWVKMGVLTAVILFTVLFKNPNVRHSSNQTMKLKCLAIVSITLWTIVAIAGRTIGTI